MSSISIHFQGNGLVATMDKLGVVHKITIWQTNIAGWNIPIFNRRYIFHPGPFSRPEWNPPNLKADLTIAVQRHFCFLPQQDVIKSIATQEPASQRFKKTNPSPQKTTGISQRNMGIHKGPGRQGPFEKPKHQKLFCLSIFTGLCNNPLHLSKIKKHHKAPTCPIKTRTRPVNIQKQISEI